MYTSGLGYFADRSSTYRLLSPLAWVTMLLLGCTANSQEPPPVPREAIVHRSGADAQGRFSYWVELPGVQPMDHDIQGLWKDEQGDYILRLDPGVRITRVQAFAATDIGKTFEGDLNLGTPGGRGLALFAPHKEQPFENRDAWGERLVDYTVPVDNTTLMLRWVCRVTGYSYDVLSRASTGRIETRCHFGLSIDAVQP